VPSSEPAEPVIYDADNSGDGGKEKKMDFISPIYDSLETNIPKRLMAFHGAEFEDEEPLFPSHKGVLRYLEQYAEDVIHLVRFRTQVLDVRPTENEDGMRWSVKTRRLGDGLRSAGEGNEIREEEKGEIDHVADLNNEKEDVETEVFDAVIVASGHYDTPFVPDIAGLRAFHEKWPTVVSHSKYYRRPEEYKDKVSLSSAYTRPFP
jgi:cation diffusion facilitator CzcD-associated flavoprotein CzcO